MSKDSLTPSQIKFAEALLSDKFSSDIERYRHAYPNNSMADKSVNKEAALLKKNPKIIEYLKTREILSKDITTTSENKKEFIEKRLKEEMNINSSTTPASRMKAIELYMKFHNMFETKDTPPASVMDVVGKLISLVERAEERANDLEKKSTIIDIN